MAAKTQQRRALDWRQLYRDKDELGALKTAGNWSFSSKRAPTKAGASTGDREWEAGWSSGA